MAINSFAEIAVYVFVLFFAGMGIFLSILSLFIVKDYIWSKLNVQVNEGQVFVLRHRRDNSIKLLHPGRYSNLMIRYHNEGFIPSTFEYRFNVEAETKDEVRLEVKIMVRGSLVFNSFTKDHLLNLDNMWSSVSGLLKSRVPPQVMLVNAKDLRKVDLTGAFGAVKAALPKSYGYQLSALTVAFVIELMPVS